MKEKLILEAVAFSRNLEWREYPDLITAQARLESGQILRNCRSSSIGWARHDLSLPSDRVNYEVVDNLEATVKPLFEAWMRENRTEIMNRALAKLSMMERQLLGLLPY